MPMTDTEWSQLRERVWMHYTMIDRHHPSETTPEQVLPDVDKIVLYIGNGTVPKAPAAGPVPSIPNAPPVVTGEGLL